MPKLGCWYCTREVQILTEDICPGRRMDDQYQGAHFVVHMVGMSAAKTEKVVILISSI